MGIVWLWRCERAVEDAFPPDTPKTARFVPICTMEDIGNTAYEDPQCSIVGPAANDYGAATRAWRSRRGDCQAFCPAATTRARTDW